MKIELNWNYILICDLIKNSIMNTFSSLIQRNNIEFAYKNYKLMRKNLTVRSKHDSYFLLVSSICHIQWHLILLLEIKFNIIIKMIIIIPLFKFELKIQIENEKIKGKWQRPEAFVSNQFSQQNLPKDATAYLLSVPFNLPIIRIHERDNKST